MADFFRDTMFGQVVRAASGNRFFQYPEEQEDFLIPIDYNPLAHTTEEKKGWSGDNSDRTLHGDETAKDTSLPDLSTIPTQFSQSRINNTSTDDSSNSLSKIFSQSNVERIVSRADLEQAYTRATERERLSRGTSFAIKPSKTADGTTLVDWYTSDDPENPQNWSSSKKSIVTLVIYLYTLAVYIGASLYTPAEPYVEKIFGVSITAAALGLALYVLGYGSGPMFFSPISEIPAVGRNPPYALTFIIFVILCVPTSLVSNFGGLLTLRFLLGFFGSPCLATGGASLGDIFSVLQVPYAMAGWSGFAVGGPSLGPVIAGFSIPAEGWRWGQWELLWIAGPVLIFMIFCLPETSASTILLRRAQRLRKLTGKLNLQSKSEIEQKQLSAGALILEALWRPMQINMLDPAILFTTLYTMIVYGIYYSFFEVFPIVYVERHGFNAGQLGLVFMAILVGLAVTIIIYFTYLWKVFEPEVRLRGLGAPERRLIPALFASLLPPVGLFMFGWTGIASIHWMVPTVGIFIFTIGVLIILLCLFIYIPMCYPQYAASLFAANDFFRSTFAAGAVLYSRPMYNNLGVGQGCSLMAGLCVGCVGGILALYHFGASLRARSKFTAK